MITKKQQPRTYQCEICKLHYDNRDDAEKCQEWCSQHNSCNLEITSRSIEALKSRHSPI